MTRNRGQACTPLPLEVAGPVDTLQHREALLEGCTLGDAHLRPEILDPARDGGLRSASDLHLAHEGRRLVGLSRQVPINPRVAVLRLLRASTREDDAVEHPARPTASSAP